MIARILGFDNEQTLLYAEKQGLALQLTNIIRDVGEDARMDRIYLPQDELERFGIAEQAVLRAILASIYRFMNFQYTRAQNLYREARDLYLMRIAAGESGLDYGGDILCFIAGNP